MRRTFIILFSVLLAVFIVLAAAWQAKGEAIMVSAREVLEQEVTKTLGSSVSVGAIDIQGISSVAISNISLHDKQGELVATAARVAVAFNPLLLLYGSNPVDAIHTVTVESPSLYVRQRADTSWNFEDFIDDKKTGGQQFGGKVRISRGQASVQTLQFGSFAADTLNAELDFKAKPSIQLDIKGNHNGAWFAVTGYVNGKSRDALTISIDSLSLPNYQSIAAAFGQPLEITSGQAKKVAIAVVSEKGELQFTGEAALEDLSFATEAVAVSNASALISFDQNTIRVFNGDLRLWDQPIRVVGDIHYRAEQPVFNIDVSSEAFDLGVLPVSAGIVGQAAFDINVKGTQDNLAAAGKVAMPAGSYQHFSFANASGRFAYSNGLLQLSGAQATIFNGQVTADGIIDLAAMQSELRIAGRQLDAAQAAKLAGIDNTGAKADFDLLLRGGLSLSAIDLAGSVTLADGQAASMPFKGAYGGFHLQQGLLTVDYFNTVIDAGMLSVKGNWDLQQDVLAFELQGTGLPLNTITRPVSDALRASGTLQFTGTLTGNLADPRLTLTATAEHGSLLDQPFEQITGVAELNRAEVILSNVQAVNNSTVHKIDGSIQLSGKKELNLTVATRKARMETLLKPLPIAEVVTGNVDNDISITGTLDSPEADGLLSLSDGSWRGFLLNAVKGAYHYRNGVVTIENTVINSLDNEVMVDGSVNAKGELALRVIASEIDLTRLPVPYPYPVSGKARLTANLMGSIDALQWDGRAIIPKLTANGQTFENVVALLDGTNQNINCPRATFIQGQSAYSLNGGINLVSKQIYGSLRAEKVQAATIAALAKLDPAIVQGEINGYFTWSGTLNNPSATFSGAVVQGTVKGYKLGDLELTASLANHVITLENLMIKQSAGIMAARGQIDLRGDTNIEAGARDIDAAFFAKLFDSTLETQGRLSFTAQITGKTADPHTSVSLEIANGSVAGASFDNLYGLFILDKGKIQVDQLLLSKGEYKASAYGVIPLAALNPESRKKASTADQLNMTFRLDHANLSILPIMTKAVAAASGETKGEIKVTGNLFEPNLSGQITVKDGTIKFVDIAESIQKVTVDIQFKNDKILVRTFEGTIGAGKYRLSGSAAVRDMAVHDYDMVLVLDKVSLTHKYFKGPVNGQLTLRENQNLPHLAGQLLVANTTVNIPMTSVADSEGSGFNMGMNVEVVIGDKVRLYNPMLYDVWVEGKVNFDGTLQEPDVSGRIESLRGTLTYLRTQFRIDEAVVAFTQFRSFEPVINLKASTRLEQTDVNLAVDGPVTAMNVKLTSDPQMSQQEILSLLTLRDKFSDRQASGRRDSDIGRDEMVSMLEAGLQLQFFAEVESMFRNSLGVDEFRVLKGSTTNQLFSSDRNGTEQDEYKIEIGKYISDRLMLRYSTGVGSNQNSYGARYDLTKQISLSADVDEFNELQVGIGMRFRF